MSQARPAHHEAITNPMNTRMAEGTLVRDHMLKKMGFFSDAKILGEKIDEETQIDMILGSLLRSSISSG